MNKTLWTLVLVMAIVPAHAAKVVLAAKGQPLATIVIPAQANDREKLAAAELQHYVKAICGVDLPLRADGKAVAGTGLYIGKCAPTQAGDLPGVNLNPESYAIHVRAGSLFFTGRYPTPTYFAVSSFIEDSLGVRWFAPGEAWEYIPSGKAGELAVRVKDTVSVPSTSPRIWSGHQWTSDWQTWDLRNKAVVSEVVPRRQFQNNVYRVFPPSKYGKDHPEYYPLINDKRWIPSDDKGTWRPCESNPEVQRLVAEYACQWFDAHPMEDSFSVGMDDISHMCGCPQCRAWDPHPDSYEKQQFSDRHYKFVNAIAREIAKTHPDRYVGTLIYAIARNLPETVDKLEPNVFGYITETSAHWWAPDIKQADHALTRAWAKRCQHLSRYDYYGMGGVTPRVYPHLMAEQIKFDKSLGMEGMYIEVYTFLPTTAPMMWACAKLQWDSKQDVDNLLGEFYAKMFGPASGTMKQYFDLLERSWCTPRKGRKGQWVHRNLKVQALAMSPADVDEGFRLLRRAAREARTDREKQRIECLRAALQYGSYPIKAYAMSQQLAQMPITDEASAAKALQMIRQMGRLARERERFWAVAPQRQDLLGDTLRGLGGMGYLAINQMPQLEQGASVAAMRMVAWNQNHAPDKAEQVLADLAQATPQVGFGSAINAWMQIKREKLPNLLKNGDFETTGQNQQQPEGDWQTKGAPEGWSLWSSGGIGTLKLLPGKGRNGSTAAALTGVTNGVYLQVLPVKPGERYLVVSFGKSDPQGSQSGTSLAVRFRQPDGSWYPRTDVEPSTEIAPGVSDWQPLLLVVEIPEGVGSMVIMPCASNQAAGATALHDDVAAYKLQ